MTVENEIKLAKIEKQLNEAVDAIMTEINIPEVLDEAAALNLRYSKLGNELMESDYSDFLLDVASNFLDGRAYRTCTGFNPIH